MEESNSLSKKRRAIRRHGQRFIWKPVPRPPAYYPIWEDWDNPDGHLWARNQPGALRHFLMETTLPMARALLASIETLWRVRCDERGKEWHEAYHGCLRVFRDMHDAGRRFYNEGRI